MHPQKDTHLTLDAQIYNNLKKTPYRLPHSVELQSAKDPYNLSISPIGLIRDRQVEVDMYGYPGLNTDDVRFFAHSDPERGCDIPDSWDSSVFRQIRADRIRGVSQ